MLKKPETRAKFVIAVIAITAVLVVIYFNSARRESRRTDELRRVLKREGFKTNLAEFDFSAPPEVRTRMAALTNGFGNGPSEASRSMNEFQVLFSLPMPRIGSHSAVRIWHESNPVFHPGAVFGKNPPFIYNLWPELGQFITSEQDRIKPAQSALLSSPVRFHLDAQRGSSILLPHLAALKGFAQEFELAAISDLRIGEKDSAWTNVMAATRLATAWTPAPIEISMLVRFACVQTALATVWQGLPAGWSEEQLESLQREWERPDFFKEIPETDAFERASALAICQQTRNDPVKFGTPLKKLIGSPRTAWIEFKQYRDAMNYKRHGSYEDERNLMLHFRDRERELREAIRAQNWAEMRRLAGVTNTVMFNPKYPFRLKNYFYREQISRAMRRVQPGEASTLMEHAAVAEAERRLVVTAIALERYHHQYGRYPDTLEKLVPRFVATAPVDFMDGQPLRYQPGKQGYLLYSVGLDCIDDGGVEPEKKLRQNFNRYMTLPARVVATGRDLIWPQEATAEEIEAFRQKKLQAMEEASEEQQQLQSERHWEWTAKRQNEVERLLSAPRTRPSSEPEVEGTPLSQLLRSKTAPTNSASLFDLLTPRQIITGDEPELMTFEVPLNYDALTNFGRLFPLIDPMISVDYFERGCVAAASGFQRASNGDTLLLISTIYEAPGKHALQLELLPNGHSIVKGMREDDEENLCGPLSPIYITNVCQFSPSFDGFNPLLGVTIRAGVTESNAHFTGKFISSSGVQLKSFSGSTSNGFIAMHWDLNTEDRRWTNGFESRFEITLPHSGKSQSLNGPTVRF
jgi:hypothetical protein